MSDLERDEIEWRAIQIIAMTTGPWSMGENLPADSQFREALMIRFEHLTQHAEAILALTARPTSSLAPPGQE